MIQKVKVARLSILSNITLIIIKVIVGLVTGSVSIISEAIHSSLDLIAALIAFFSVRVSDNPPDSRHPYGHGKFENISGVVEAILILGAALWIIVEAVKKLIAKNIEIKVILIGSLVMALSALINLYVSGKLSKTAKETKSLALEADALHLRTDVYTSAGVAAGLILIFITEIRWLDPVIAIAVALFIFIKTFSLLKKAFIPLLDTAWDDNEIETLKMHLDDMGVNYHDLRTRLAGNYRFIDVHIEVPENESVGDAHKYCDMVENDLKKTYENLTVTIHVEPEG